MLVRPLIDEFRKHFLFERGRALGTVTGYCSDLHHFMTQLETPGSELVVSDMTQERAQGWLTDLSAAGLHPSTVNRKRCALSAFIKYLRRRRRIALDVELAELLVPPRPLILPPLYVKDDMLRLVRAPLAGQRFVDARDAAMMHMDYEAGLRASEVVGIDLDSLLWDTPSPGQVTVVVRGKGNKERPVTLRKSAAVLRAYVEERRRLQTDEKALFVGVFQGRRLSRTGYGKVVRRRGDRLGLRVSPHSLRHACAQHLRQNGTPLETIQDLLGHVELRTTRHYAQASRAEMEGAVDRHPLNLPDGYLPPTQEEMLRQVLALLQDQRRGRAARRRATRRRPTGRKRGT